MRTRILTEEEKARKRAYMAEYRKNYPDKARESVHRSYRKYAEYHRMKARVNRSMRAMNPEKLNHYRAYCRRKMAERLKNDPQFRIRFRLRNRIWMSLDRGVAKAGSTVELVGCPMADLKLYLESKWQRGMSWDNYGKGPGKWHIDHIRPCSSFDLTDPAQQKECFHFSNMQPLWQFDNLSKGNRQE